MPIVQSPPRRPEVGVATPGVNLAGYFRAEAGVGEAARLLVQTLRAGGVPYTLVPVTRMLTRQESPWVDEGGGGELHATNIVCVNADQLPAFVQDVGMSLLEGRYTIGMWWWEVEDFPEWMRFPASLLDEIWVGSRHTAEAIGKVIDLPVVVCPPAIVEPRPGPVDLAGLGIGDRPFFLYCFDFNSDFERKNPLGLLAAYERAFSSGEGPALVLKCVNGAQRPRDLRVLTEAATGLADVVVVDRHLDLGALHGLMAACTAYVSLHRAEGFGLTIAEAMALGKPAIATAYSGNLDFMRDDNSCLVPYVLVEIPPGRDPYPIGSRWAEPDVNAAAEAMRRVWEHPEDARARAKLAQRELLTEHTPKARGAVVARRLEEVARLEPRPRPRTLTRDHWVGDPLLADLWTLHALPDLHPAVSNGAGPVSGLRRVLHRLLFPLVHRQSEYNVANTRVVEAVRASAAANAAELERLSARIRELERQEEDGLP